MALVCGFTIDLMNKARIRTVTVCKSSCHHHFSLILSSVKVRDSLAAKERKKKLVHETLSFSWGSAGSATSTPGCSNLLMGLCALVQCTTAVLHYSSHPEPSEWIAYFFPPMNGFKQRFVERMDDFHLWFSVSFVDVYRQDLHSAQSRDNQTATSNRLLVTMPKVLSLNVSLHKLGEEKWPRHACVLISVRNRV